MLCPGSLLQLVPLQQSESSPLIRGVQAGMPYAAQHILVVVRYVAATDNRCGMPAPDCFE